MTELTKATPRPWVQFLDRNAQTIELLPAGRPGSTAVVISIATKEGDANAALIVRAVNLHDELVAALRRFVSISAWNHDEAHNARREYDNAADEACAVLAKVDVP